MNKTGSAVRLSWKVAQLSPRRLVGVAGTGALSAACGVGLMATSGWLITRASQRPPVLSLCIAIGAVQAFSLAKGIARYLERISSHGASLDVLGRLRLHLFDVLVPLVPGGLGTNSTGDVLSGFVSDTELVAEGFAKTTIAATDVTASIVLGTVVALLTMPLLGVITVGGGLVVVAVSVLLARLGRASDARAGSERAELASLMIETVRSAKELVAYGRQDLVTDRLEEVRHRSGRLAARRSLTLGLARAWAIVASAGVLVAVVAAGLAAVDARRLSGVMLAVVAFAALAVLDQCATVPVVVAGTNEASAAAERLARLERLAPPAQEPELDQSKTATAGSAELVGAETTAPDGTIILRGLSLEVGTSKRVALTGPSGSGKTNAVYALLHFVNCQKGQARLGGGDVSQMTREGIAALAGWVADETHIFAASLSDNLRLAQPSASDADCDIALQRAGLSGWSASLPAGLATVLGAGGRPLSAGERQRIGLARILLAGPPVLLLDEPTAHLDPVSSAKVLVELLDAAGDRGVLVVSHEPDVSRYVDRVVVLDGGRVASVSAGSRGAQLPNPVTLTGTAELGSLPPSPSSPSWLSPQHSTRPEMPSKAQ
jgi:thiol reductant ABC exporter CydC subunit